MRRGCPPSWRARRRQLRPRNRRPLFDGPGSRTALATSLRMRVLRWKLDQRFVGQLALPVRACSETGRDARPRATRSETARSPARAASAMWTAAAARRAAIEPQRPRSAPRSQHAREAMSWLSARRPRTDAWMPTPPGPRRSRSEASGVSAMKKRERLEERLQLVPSAL